MTDKQPTLYGVDSPPFVEHLREVSLGNRDRIRALYATPIAHVEVMLDAYHAFSCEHVWTFELTRPQPTAIEKLLFSAVHKNQIALFAILEMTQTGLFGPVRPLLRQVFEFQVLAKFIAVTGNGSLAERWLNGHMPAIGREVLPRIRPPHSQHLTRFWRTLHPFVHASPYSQQVSPYADHNEEEVGLDLMLLMLVMHNQYHLLDRHAFNQQSRRYAAKYAPAGRLASLRGVVREVQTANIPHFSTESKALVRSFRGRWT